MVRPSLCPLLYLNFWKMKRYGAAGSSVLGRSKLPTVGYAIRLFFVYYNLFVIIS